MPDANPKSRFEIAVELVKALAWPVVVLIVLIAFWSSLHSIADSLPNIISRSETITIAGLSIKVSKGLSKQPSEQVKQAISKLSSEGFRRLLNSGGASFWDRPDVAIGKSDNAELLRLGLMEEVPSAELQDRANKRSYGYGVRLTPLGKETQNFLIEFVSSVTQELGKSSNESDSKK